MLRLDLGKHRRGHGSAGKLEVVGLAEQRDQAAAQVLLAHRRCLEHVVQQADALAIGVAQVLLDQANNLQLAGRPVPETLLTNLRSQHAELMKQQRIIAEQRVERASLDGELVDALARYRAFKNPDEAEPAR